MNHVDRKNEAPSSRTRPRTEACTERWNAFFFTEERVEAAVYFRIFLAVWTAAFFIPRLPYLAELYTDQGFHVRHPLLRHLWCPELPLWAVWSCVLLLLGCLVGFAAGYQARKLHVVVVILLCYLFGYDVTTVRGYGQLAFYQWLLAYWLPYDRLVRGDGDVRVAERWGVRLVMMLFGSVYGFTVLAKTVGGEGWLDGRTPYYTFHGRDYGSVLLSAVVPLSLDQARVLGWCTLASEAFIAAGLWHRRTKIAAMIVCVGMHVMMALTLRVSILFHFVMIGHLPLFLSPNAWAKIGDRLRYLASPKPSVRERPAEP